jgi:hypothetical protein
VKTWAISGLFILAATAACGLADPPGLPKLQPRASDSSGGGEAGEMDATSLLAAISGGAYQTSTTFTQLTLAPYPSVAAPGSMVREWVSAFALADYAQISPGVSGSGVTLPEGTTIVREVLDADGGVDKLTIMAKGPPGYNPELGDWWFGVTAPEGIPLETDAGLLMGRLTECYSCHAPRSDDGFLFGVPLGDRAPAASN